MTSHLAKLSISVRKVVKRYRSKCGIRRKGQQIPFIFEPDLIECHLAGGEARLAGCGGERPRLVAPAGLRVKKKALEKQLAL